MKQVLLLTKNIYACKPIQEKLQTLNYEVFCSAELINYYYDKKFILREISKFFQIVIISETVSESISLDIINTFEGVNIFREADVESDDKMQLFIKPNISLEDIRELMNTTEVVVKKGFPSQNEKNLSLSCKERKVLQILNENLGEIVSRETICKYIWKNDTITPSNLSQLSCIISRIKTKFSRHNDTDELITTVWGQGYRMNPTFSFFELNENFK